MTHYLKAVLVGCGSISHQWVRTAAEIDDFDLVGFVDLDETAAHRRATDYGNPEAVISTDLESTLEEIRPDIVFDCTVPQAHMQVILTALKYGAHVLGEKPLADSLGNAHRMIDAARQAGKTYAVMQNRRYDPNIRRVCALIDSGVIGPLTMVTSDFFVPAHFGDFREHMPHILLIDMAIHTFDAARLITGADPVSVYCKEWNPAGSWYGYPAAAIATFEMSNGAVYSYRGSWCAEGLRTTWESDWRIIGQQGTILWPGDEHIQAQSVAQGERRGLFLPVRDIAIPDEIPAGKTGGHAGCIKEFVEAVRGGQTPETVAADNIKSLAMVFAAIESAESGQPVRVRW